MLDSKRVEKYKKLRKNLWHYVLDNLPKDYLKLDKNIGKAEAIRAAVLSISNTDFIAYYDADLATPFSELDKLIQRLKNYV